MRNDLSDIYRDTDTLFAAVVLSDAMRRGVRHFRRDGTPLERLDQVLDALHRDGEVMMDNSWSKGDRAH